ARPLAPAGRAPRTPGAALLARVEGIRRGYLARPRARAARPGKGSPAGVNLGRDFYARSVHDVARDLIGCVVRHDETAGRIVETESYHMEEPACHAFAGVTDRTSTLFGEPGNAYVHFSYGVHSLLNEVAEEPGVGAAVLIRALEPVDGVEAMRERRGVPRDEELCSGPG